MVTKRLGMYIACIICASGFTIVWPAVQLRLRGGVTQYDQRAQQTATTLAQNDEYTLSVVCDGQAQDILIDGLDDTIFRVQQAGSSSNMSMINGVTKHSVTYNYHLQPLKQGSHTIGPASVVVNGRSEQSDSIAVTVVDDATYDAQVGRTSSRSVLTCEMELEEATVVVGQEAILTVFVEDDGTVSNRSLQSPSFGNLSFTAIGEPVSQQRLVNGQARMQITQQYRVSADKPGTYTIGPAIAHFVVQERDEHDPLGAFFNMSMGSLFAGGKRRSVRSNSVQLSVEKLPETEQSVDGVGQFSSLELRTSKSVVELNEPFTISLTVKGSGNFDAMLAPTLQISDEVTVYDATGKQEAGAKVFEYVIQIGKAGSYTLPGQSICYFNTKTQSYQQLESNEVSIRVKEEKVRALVHDEPIIKKQQATHTEFDDGFDDDEAEPVSALSWWWFVLLVLLPLLIIVRRHIRSAVFALSERLGFTSQDKRDAVRLQSIVGKGQVEKLHGFFVTVLMRTWACRDTDIESTLIEQKVFEWEWDIKKTESFVQFIQGSSQAAFAAQMMSESEKGALLDKAIYWHTMIVQQGKRGA